METQKNVILKTGVCVSIIEDSVMIEALGAVSRYSEATLKSVVDMQSGNHVLIVGIKDNPSLTGVSVTLDELAALGL